MKEAQNPYKVNEEPIIQYKLEAKAWDEGWDARKWQDYDTIIAMHKAILDAKKTLRDIDIWYVKVIAGRMGDDKGKTG